MNEAVKEMWKAALISGEYEQGVGDLKSPRDKYCCLGVLSELYRKETGKGEWTADSRFLDVTGDISGSFLTEGVRKWAELPTSCPSVGPSFLHSLNDNGVPFVEIAKLLDEL